MPSALHDQPYDPFSPAVMRDPLPFYHALRARPGLTYLPQYDAYAVARFADIAEVLAYTDNHFMQSEGSLPLPAVLRRHNDGPLLLPQMMPLPLSQRLGMPLHGELRRAHIKPLMPRFVHQMAADIGDLVEQRLDALLPQGRFDLVRDFGGIISSSVILRLMGIPEARAGEALDIINSGTRTDPEVGGFDSGAVAREAIDFYLPYIAARMEAGADGTLPLVDGMINWRHEGRALTPREVAVQLVCAFIGGIETVPKIVGQGLMELAARPDQLAAIRADLPANIPAAAEEILRYTAPAQWFMRTVQEPVTIAGQDLRPGQRLFLLFAAANRDGAEFPDPESFIWNRPIKRALVFGQGIHFCIGAHLARLEVQVITERFLSRVGDYHVDHDAAVRHPSSFQWGYNHLPVVIGPARRAVQ